MIDFSNFDLIVLFFFLGFIGSLLKVPLKYPESISQFLAIYLLLAIGLKGGLQVASAQSLADFLPALLLGLFSCILIPALLFPVAKKHFGLENAAALAAVYGSVSAVTFVVAQSFLDSREISYGGYMVAVMALMEVPAIAMALFFFSRSSNEAEGGVSWIRAAFAHKSIILLLGGFSIGLVLEQKNIIALKPVMTDAFKGILAFYLLDLGCAAAQGINILWKQKARAILFAFVFPFIFGVSILLLAMACQLEKGDGILLAILAGSASYIAAPAAIRVSIPSASPALFTTLPLALTFTFNVLLGIPLYIYLGEILFK